MKWEGEKSAGPPRAAKPVNVPIADKKGKEVRAALDDAIERGMAFMTETPAGIGTVMSEAEVEAERLGQRVARRKGRMIRLADSRSRSTMNSA